MYWLERRCQPAEAPPEERATVWSLDTRYACLCDTGSEKTKMHFVITASSRRSAISLPASMRWQHTVVYSIPSSSRPTLYLLIQQFLLSFCTGILVRTSTVCSQVQYPFRRSYRTDILGLYVDYGIQDLRSYAWKILENATVRMSEWCWFLFSDT